MKVRISRCKRCGHFKDMLGNALHQCMANGFKPCRDVDYRNCKFENPVNPVNPVRK